MSQATWAESMKALLVGLVILFTTATAHARVEGVVVKKVMDDKAIIVRLNGEMYLLEKGVGCLSLWRFEGKRVDINSPGLFLGVGSNLVIPDIDQQCRIWNSNFLGSESARTTYQPRRTSPPVSDPTGQRETALMIQKALRILGYDVVADGVLTDKTKEAFARYQASKGHPRTEAGIRLSLMSLALDLLNKPCPDALPVANALYRAAKASTSDSSSSGCVEGHWISSVMSDGKLIKLEDGSIWEVDSVDAVESVLWLPAEEILICGKRLINTDNGETVGAKRVK